MLYTEQSLVTMADVDAAGIIYFATPLRWAEKLYSLWLHGLGHPHRQMFAEGVATPAVNVTADYRSHLSLDDEVRLELTAARIGATSFTLRLEAFMERCGGPATRPRRSVAAVDVQTTHVFSRYTHPSYGDGARTEKQPLPQWLRSALETGYREQAAPRRQQLT
jgi:YbgC/YbaW family acyl-CoA thioester hydrolase